MKVGPRFSLRTLIVMLLDGMAKDATLPQEEFWKRIAPWIRAVAVSGVCLWGCKILFGQVPAILTLGLTAIYVGLCLRVTVNWLTNREIELRQKKREERQKRSQS